MVERHGNWRGWRDFFAARSTRPAPQLLDDDPLLASVPQSVARSLAVFQLGESGGGTIIEQARKSRLPGIDAHYAEAMASFVAEEHRHAELLACCVRALRGELIRKNWTARLFVFGRRLIGLRLKVMVLLAAEVVGICYYHLLSARLPDSGMRSLLQEIVEDEKAHLRFHCSFLRTQARNEIQRAVFLVTWRALMLAAAVVVLVDHRHSLRDLDIAPAVAWRRWMLYSRTAENLITQPRRRASAQLATR
jgi:hypothetical protein